MPDDVDKTQLDSIDFVPDNKQENGQEVDSVSALTDASFYGYSIRSDFAKAAVAHANASYLQNQAGSELFTLNNGPIKNLPGSEEKSEDEKALDAMRENAEFVMEELKRQREEWKEQIHSFAGADLTGEQWGELGAELQKDGPLKEWLIARLMKNGNTRDDAEQKAKEITQIAQTLAKPETEWTAEERTKVESGRNNKEFQEVMPELADQMLNGAYGLADKNALHSEKSQSVAVGDDAFASAPDLSQHHAAALSAKTPLDTIKPLAATPPPPEPSMGGLG